MVGRANPKAPRSQSEVAPFPNQPTEQPNRTTLKQVPHVILALVSMSISFCWVGIIATVLAADDARIDSYRNSSQALCTWYVVLEVGGGLSDPTAERCYGAFLRKGIQGVPTLNLKSSRA